MGLTEWLVGRVARWKNQFDEYRLARRWRTLQAMGMHIGQDVWLPGTTAIDTAHCYLISIGDHCGFGDHCLILAHDAVATLSIQWDNRVYVMLVIWAVGAFIIGRLKRFHICLTYVVSFLAYGVIRHFITGDPLLAEIAPITGPMYQLFTFFMITDPPTTVKGRVPQMIVVFLVATAEFILRTVGSLHVAWGGLGPWIQIISVHAPYFALFSVGPIAFVTQMLGWWGQGQGAANPSGVAVAQP